MMTSKGTVRRSAEPRQTTTNIWAQGMRKTCYPQARETVHRSFSKRRDHGRSGPTSWSSRATRRQERMKGGEGRSGMAPLLSLTRRTGAGIRRGQDLAHTGARIGFNSDSPRDRMRSLAGEGCSLRPLCRRKVVHNSHWSRAGRDTDQCNLHR